MTDEETKEQRLKLVTVYKDPETKRKPVMETHFVDKTAHKNIGGMSLFKLRIKESVLGAPNSNVEKRVLEYLGHKVLMGKQGKDMLELVNEIEGENYQDVPAESTPDVRVQEAKAPKSSGKWCCCCRARNWFLNVHIGFGNENEQDDAVEKVRTYFNTNEKVLSALKFKEMNHEAFDYIFFTDSRILQIDHKNVNKNDEVRSFPYDDIASFSITTLGTADTDAELTIFFKTTKRSFKSEGGDAEDCGQESELTCGSREKMFRIHRDSFDVASLQYLLFTRIVLAQNSPWWMDHKKRLQDLDDGISNGVADDNSSSTDVSTMTGEAREYYRDLKNDASRQTDREVVATHSFPPNSSRFHALGRGFLRRDLYVFAHARGLARELDEKMVKQINIDIRNQPLTHSGHGKFPNLFNNKVRSSSNLDARVNFLLPEMTKTTVGTDKSTHDDSTIAGETVLHAFTKNNTDRCFLLFTTHRVLLITSVGYLSSPSVEFQSVFYHEIISYTVGSGDAAWTTGVSGVGAGCLRILTRGGSDLVNWGMWPNFGLKHARDGQFYVKRLNNFLAQMTTKY